MVGYTQWPIRRTRGPAALFIMLVVVPGSRPTLIKVPKSWEGGVELGGVGDEDLEPSSNRTAYCGCLLLPPLTGWGLRCMSGHAQVRDGRSRAAPPSPGRPSRRGQRLHRRPMATTAMRQGKGRLAGATPRRDWTPWEDGPRPTLSGSEPLSPPFLGACGGDCLERVEGWGRVAARERGPLGRPECDSTSRHGGALRGSLPSSSDRRRDGYVAIDGESRRGRVKLGRRMTTPPQGPVGQRQRGYLFGLGTLGTRGPTTDMTPKKGPIAN